MDLGIKGRRAIVCASSKGLGRACAMALANGMDAYLDQQNAIINRPDSRPQLAAIDCPTLIVVGDGDQITPPPLAHEMADLIAGSRVVVVPKAGHMALIEQPQAVTDALVGWLS